MHDIPPYILWVDCNAELGHTLKPFFDQLGWHVDTVPSAEQAIDAAQGTSYDVVLMDLEMPDLPVWDLLQRLRGARSLQPVVIVAPEGHADAAMACMQAGAVDFFTQPLDLSALKESVTRIASAQRLQSLECQMSRHMTEERCRYMFTSAELDVMHPGLPIVDRLFHVGIIDGQTRLRILLAFQEALTNSLEHGNLELKSEWKEILDENAVDKYSMVRRERLALAPFAERLLHVTTLYDGKKLELTIEDEGSGFLDKQLEIEHKPANEMRCHGRGLAIMKASLDEVTFENNGSVVKMVKYL